MRAHEALLHVRTSLAGPINAVAGIQQMGTLLPFGLSLVDNLNSNDQARVRYSGKLAPCLTSPSQLPAQLVIFQAHLKKAPKKSGDSFVQPWMPELADLMISTTPRQRLI